MNIRGIVRDSMVLILGVGVGLMLGSWLADRNHLASSGVPAPKEPPKSLLPIRKSSSTIDQSYDALVAPLENHLESLGLSHLVDRADFKRHLEIYERASKDPRELAEEIFGNLSALKNLPLMTLFAAWIKHDPEDAIRGLEELGKKRRVNPWWSFVGGKIAETDPQKGYDVLREHDVPKWDIGYLKVTKSMAAKDLGKANEFWKGSSDEELKLMGALGVAEFLLETGRDTDQWLDEFDDKDLAMRVGGHLLAILGKRDPGHGIFPTAAR